MSDTAAQGAPSAESAQSATVTLPLVHARVYPEHLAYFAAIGVLAAIEVIEWPLAAVMIGGQIIAARAHNRLFREVAAGVGEAV
jgi:uncharacterized membrane protein YjdF